MQRLTVGVNVAGRAQHLVGELCTEGTLGERRTERNVIAGATARRVVATAVEGLDRVCQTRSMTSTAGATTLTSGRAGYDVALRAALAKGALGAQLANEVLCAACDVDADGEPLHGRHDYELHFPPGEHPPVSLFWNMSLLGEDLMFVENDAGRYSIGNTTDGLASNP